MCSILAKVATYVGRTVVVRGLVVSDFSDSGLQLITGPCRGGLFLQFSRRVQATPGFAALSRAVDERPLGSGGGKRVFASLSGVVGIADGQIERSSGIRRGRPYLRVGRVEDVTNAPDLTVLRAEMPVYPPIEALLRRSGCVSAQVRVRSGAVTVVRVLRSADAGLDAEAVKNIRSWRFEPWTSAQFETAFCFDLSIYRHWPVPYNPRIEMELPERVTVTEMRGWK